MFSGGEGRGEEGGEDGCMKYQIVVWLKEKYKYFLQKESRKIFMTGPM